MEELWIDLPLTSANFEALAKGIQVLPQKAEKVDFYYHWVAEFKSLQMEHILKKRNC